MAAAPTIRLSVRWSDEVDVKSTKAFRSSAAYAVKYLSFHFQL